MQKKQLLIAMIDDEENFLEMTQAILEEAGYNTFCTTDPDVFLEYFQLHEIDIAIVDVEMPLRNGYELVTELREGGANPELPVIFLSAHRETGDQLQGFYSGANEYLFKPANRFELIETIEKLSD
jgi:DNA-binding response OmpR family regulator